MKALLPLTSARIVIGTEAGMAIVDAEVFASGKARVLTRGGIPT